VIHLDVPQYERFAESLQIPSRDEGLVPLRLWGTQRRAVREIARGLEEDVHDFVILKGGRQIGGTTTVDTLTLYWPMKYEGTTALFVSDDMPNKLFRRDIMRQMLQSQAPEWRRPVAMDNQGILRWDNGSRLLFEEAGVRSNSNLGRSRGVNYLHADEVGSWKDLRAASALRNSLSKLNPQRLYVWNSTARGVGSPFHEMWRTACRVPTQRAIFLSWWMHEANALVKPGREASKLQRQLWTQYALPDRDESERLWIAEVKRSYQHVITDAQLGWYRWMLDADMHGDETLMAQEFGVLPEECFQSFGDKIVSAHTIRALRVALKSLPACAGFRYDFRQTLDVSHVREVEPEYAQLRVWEQPADDAAYVVAGHPAWSSSGEAHDHVVQVFRAWPDRLRQVAAFHAYGDDLYLYQFAWVFLHLAGAYRTWVPAMCIFEISATGYRVMEEMQLLSDYGYGLSTQALAGGLRNLLASVSHYFYVRPDNLFARSAPLEFKTSHELRPWIIHGLRDTLERGHLEVADEELIDEMASLRRGEHGDHDEIAAGGTNSDARALCAALAVECWMKQGIPLLSAYMAPREISPMAPTHAGQRLVQSYMHQRVLNPPL